MVKVHQLTAETLLLNPRRGPAVPNSDGTIALYTVSTPRFGEAAVEELRFMNISNGSSWLICQDDKVHDAQWLPGTNDQIVYLRTDDKGFTEVKIARTGDLPGDHSLLTIIWAPVANMKLRRLEDGSAAVVLTGLVGPDGDLFNDIRAEKKSSGRVFDTGNVRTWNKLYKTERYSLWYTKLFLEEGRWALAEPIINLLKDTTLEPSGLYDGLDDPKSYFDICEKGIAFIARDHTDHAVLSRGITKAFFSPLDSFTSPPSQEPRPIQLPEEVVDGISQSIRTSPESSHIGILHTANNDAINTRLYVTSIGDYAAFDVVNLVTGDYDTKDYSSPISFEFSGSSESVILSGFKNGRVALSHLKFQDVERPKYLTSEGSVQAFYPIVDGNWDKLLVTSTSYIDSGLWQIVDVADASVESTVFSATQNGRKFGLSADMVSEIWFEGADGLCVHSFIIKPSSFDEDKKYPWVLMPHGGPVHAWSDEWSTRWNMAAWAEQGYIVICPNVSGSLGFGLDFARRINDEWGGKPYTDLVNLIGHIETLPYIDQSKAVLAGASYGGYMVSWFLGHEIVKKFCCAVWHDGIFDLPKFMLETDWPVDDQSFNGPPYPWLNQENLEKFNPARPDLLSNWGSCAPPTLVIHSEKDYRCPITHGIAVFQTLQAQGVPSRFLTFDDECHFVLKPENSLFWHQTVWDWVKRCVDGEIKRGDSSW